MEFTLTRNSRWHASLLKGTEVNRTLIKFPNTQNAEPLKMPVREEESYSGFY